MKQLALVPLVVVVAACASHAPKTTPIASTAPISHSVTDPSGIRLAEKIRKYRFGRYIDPGDPLVMHDAHPVYRVEQTAAWNLRPANKAPPGRSSAASPSPEATQRDAELAELNKQRAATRAFTEQAVTLNQRLAEFTKAVAQIQEIANRTCCSNKRWPPSASAWIPFKSSPDRRKRTRSPGPLPKTTSGKAASVIHKYDQNKHHRNSTRHC
jgi:hypothetical protein